MSLLHSTSSSCYPGPAAAADFRKGLEYVLDSHLSHHHHHHHHDAAFSSFTQQQQQQQQDNYYYAAHSNSSSDENNNGGSFHLPNNYMLSPPPPPLPTDNDVKQEQIGGGGGSTPQFINMDDPPTQQEEESNKNNSCMDFPHKMTSSPLVRHSSSPADFFSTFALHNHHHHGLGAINGPPNTVTNNVMNFSSLSESRPVIMPCIAETGNGGRHFMSTLANSDESWGNAGQKRPRDSSEEEENRPHHASLAHHMSLPANFGVVAATDNLLQFEGHVPCKVRAKRGFATHPRSIAERVRRSRISKKMTKLQDLFPDMDKQTSQADMLDMAVDHIKKLEKQVKALAEKKAKCSCPVGEEEQKQS